MLFQFICNQVLQPTLNYQLNNKVDVRRPEPLISILERIRSLVPERFYKELLTRQLFPFLEEVVRSCSVEEEGGEEFFLSLPPWIGVL